MSDDFCSGILHVHIGEGSEMRNPDGIIKADPYLHVRYGDDVSIGKIHRKAGSTCQFDWKIQFPFDVTAAKSESFSAPPIPSLEIRVMDQNTARPDATIGMATIDPSDILSATDADEHCFQKRLELTFSGKILRGERVGGLLEVSLWWEARTNMQEPFPLPCHRLMENKSSGGGLLRQVVDGGKYDALRTWQINLWGVHPIFGGTLCGWNREYDAAKQIYGSNTSCAAIRAAIHTQHKLLYSHEEKFAKATATMHHIIGMEQLLDALPARDINTSEGKCTRYTYVICADSMMNFSVTAAMTGRDFLSKHAVHANAAENIVYAGEFFVDTSLSTRRLVIDNNSGTFAPPNKKLYDLKKLLEFNFGTHVPILVPDRSHPLLKELCELNDVE
jgi:hypothetical protein